MRSIAIEHDLAVPMRDGVRLFVNLFKPEAGGSYPVIMSVTPYGKDKLPDRLTTFFMRLSGVKFGKLNCSRLTGFESPDPVYWVQDDARLPPTQHRQQIWAGDGHQLRGEWTVCAFAARCGSDKRAIQ